MNLLPTEQRLAEMDRRLRALENPSTRQLTAHVTLEITDIEGGIDIETLAAQIETLVSAHGAKAQPLRPREDPGDPPATHPERQAIHLLKTLKRIAAEAHCSLAQAAWAFSQTSVPADLTHAVQPFPEAD